MKNEIDVGVEGVYNHNQVCSEQQLARRLTASTGTMPNGRILVKLEVSSRTTMEMESHTILRTRTGMGDGYVGNDESIGADVKTNVSVNTSG